MEEYENKVANYQQIYPRIVVNLLVNIQVKLSKCINTSQFTSKTDQNEPQIGGPSGPPGPRGHWSVCPCPPSASSRSSRSFPPGRAPCLGGGIHSGRGSGIFPCSPRHALPGWPPNTRGPLEVLVGLSYRLFGLSWETIVGIRSQ